MLTAVVNAVLEDLLNAEVGVRCALVESLVVLVETTMNDGMNS